MDGNYHGTTSVGPHITPNDVFRPLVSFVVPIPENIEVRAEGGVPAMTRLQVPVNPSYGELRKTADSRNEMIPNTQRDSSVIRDIVDHGRNADSRISIPVTL